MMGLLAALGEFLFLTALAPVLLAGELAAFWITDLLATALPGKPPRDEAPRSRAVSVVIPTWNGKHHLAANLASVVQALEDHPDSEIIVVENGSDDGSAEFLQQNFPQVRILAFDENRGFGGGSNAGFEAAKNDIVVLLNNDMRVEPAFLEPLLDGFSDPQVFAVTAQIFFADPAKRREETGLTMGRWAQGRLVLSHIVDEQVDRLFPTFYAGGGSTAYDRRKFLELGGFDKLLRPFYMEDADVSYQAWKRGWKVLYAPASVVYHEHRGTIGKRFSAQRIERIIQKNNLLFAWKNIHDPGKLAGHFGWTWLAMWARWIAGPSPTRPGALAFLLACGQTFEACSARLRARRLATISDREALRRPLGGFYRDRFVHMPAQPERLNVLFVSPYGMEPPIHGGGVFMNQTVRHLSSLCRLHLLCLVDEESELATNHRFAERCASAEILLRWRERLPASSALTPYAAQHFWHPDLLWRLHRSIYLREIDAVQLEYTQLAIYAMDLRRIATFLFEHDIYFQTTWRGMAGERSLFLKWRRFYEYLRALRFERRSLKRFDAIQVCTAANQRFLQSFVWNSVPIEAGLRAGIDVGRYVYRSGGREPDTLLFVGNFKHPPNQSALSWFVENCWPRVKASRPAARLIAVGAQAPPEFAAGIARREIEFRGAVADIRDELGRYAVFVAPILSGSGVRVKLLEAFAAGIPVVATRIGAEGLAEQSGRIAELADDPRDFANAALRLLADSGYAQDLARRARQEIEAHWDMAQINRRLAERYRQTVERKRSGPGSATFPPPSASP